MFNSITRTVQAACNSARCAPPLAARGWVAAVVIAGAMVAATAAHAVEVVDHVFSLHPPPALVQMTEGSDTWLPFSQTVPFEQGRLMPDQLENGVIGSARLEAHARPMTYWPDGSVRLALVEGVVPAGTLDGDALSAQFVAADGAERESDTLSADRNPVHDVAAEGDALMLLDPDANVLATLSPEAAWSPISQAKIIYPNDPELNDAVAQYGWAHPLEDLDAEAQSRPLSPRVRHFAVEAETRVYTDYLVQGDAGEAAPGKELEWQLRLRVYRPTPVVRWQMTWAMHWDPESHALARAAWVLRPAEEVRSASVPAANDEPAESLRVPEGAAAVQFEPDGTGVVEGLQAGPRQVDRPDDRWHSMAVESGSRWIGVAVCDLSRLGPSHLQVNDEAIEAAAWSDRSGMGMDLRASTDPEEFGIGGGDLEADGRGVAFSLEGAWVFADREDEAATLARAEAARDHLWFPSAQRSYETGALGDRVHPDTLSAGDEIAPRHRHTQQVAYFLKRSREHWRWYGALNYGDVRTNFKANEDHPDRGLFADRWGLHGRYGWRNGSSDVHGRMLSYGLLLEDRRLILAALDYARHVADVDVKHASFFREPEGEQGGMHRRNKDHWSGGIEPQYTPSRGLYLASWMTGNRRYADVLQEVRAFTRDVDRQAFSAFRGEAWINRYAEMRDPEDLAVAEQLIEACVASWSGRSGQPEALSGLSVIYFDNFRRVGNGMLVLIDFYRETGEARYLDAILESVRYHGVNTFDDSYLVAFLLSEGVEPERIGASLIEQARQRVPGEGARDSNPTPKDRWTYDWLRQRIRTNQQSYNIGRRMRYLPLAHEVFVGQER